LTATEPQQDYDKYMRLTATGMIMTNIAVDRNSYDKHMRLTATAQSIDRSINLKQSLKMSFRV